MSKRLTLNYLNNQLIDLCEKNNEINVEIFNKIDSIEKKLENFETDIENIYDRVKELEKKDFVYDNLENKLLNLEQEFYKFKEENCLKAENINLKEVKIENIEIEKNTIMKYLEANNQKYDIKLIILIYVKNFNNESSIKIKNKKIIFWNENEWKNNDNLLMNILTNIIKRLYIKVNRKENYENNIIQFENNQKHIFDISSEKYKASFIKNLKNTMEEEN